MSSPEAPDKPPTKRIEKKLISWSKVTCFALALAVEHQRFSDGNNNPSTPNWQAVIEIMNAVLLQESESFRDAHPNGLSDPNKLRSEFSDRSRGRSPKWRLAKEDCTPEEILAMENIARVVIATERSLAPDSGNHVRELGDNPIDWIVYRQRDPNEGGKTPAPKKKKAQQLQPSRRRASSSSEPVRPSSDLDSDDEDDDNVTLAPAPSYTALPLNAFDHLAEQYDQQTAARGAAPRRIVQEVSESEEDDEEFPEMIQLGPRLFERAPKKKRKGPPKKKVRFSSPNAEESEQTMGQRTAGPVLPGGIADVSGNQSFSRPAQPGSQSFSQSMYPAPSLRPEMGSFLPANAFDHLLDARPVFPPSNQDMGSSLSARSFGQSIDRRVEFPPRSQDMGLAQPASGSINLYPAGYPNSQNASVSQSTQPIHQSTYPSPDIRPGTHGGSLSSAQSFSQSINPGRASRPRIRRSGPSPFARLGHQSAYPSPTIRPGNQGIGTSLSTQPFNQSINPGPAPLPNLQRASPSPFDPPVHQSTYPSPAIRPSSQGMGAPLSMQPFGQSINPGPANLPSSHGSYLPFSAQPLRQSINPRSPYFPVSYDESLLSAEAFRQSIAPIPEFLSSIQDVQNTLSSFSGPPLSESIDTGPNLTLSDNDEGLSLSVSPVRQSNVSVPTAVSGFQNDNTASSASPFGQPLNVDPALSSGGQVDTDHNSALRVNAELNRRHQPTRPPTYPSDFLAKLPVPNPKNKQRGGLSNPTARSSATPPPYPAQRPYYGDGLPEAHLQPLRPVQYTWEACKRVLMIGMQAGRWPNFWDILLEVPGVDLSSWNYMRDLVNPLALTTGLPHPDVRAAVEEALRRNAITSLRLQHLLTMPTMTHGSPGDPSNWLNSIIQRVQNNSKLPMVHTNDVEFSSGEPIYVVRNHKTNRNPTTGVYTVDDIEQHIHFIDQNTVLYMLAGEVRRVNFIDEITKQSQQMDVMLCDDSICRECQSGARYNEEREKVARLRQGLPVVHQKDIIMQENLLLAFGPREQGPKFGDVPLAAREVHDVVFGNGKHKAIFCNKNACTACLPVPCPASSTWSPPEE